MAQVHTATRALAGGCDVSGSRARPGRDGLGGAQKALRVRGQDRRRGEGGCPFVSLR